MTTPHVKIVYGSAGITHIDKADMNSVVDILKKNNVDEIDTARIYPGSEKALGDHGFSKHFIVDTKARGFAPNALTSEGIKAAIDESLSDLQVDSVETYFLHSPDPATPIEETLAAINELYNQKKFKRFGVSNFSPSQVEQIYDLCHKHGYVLPSVYQGNYNAVSRAIESDLFPILRKLNISFYAYSPIAGGFLARTKQDLTSGTPNRFNQKDMVGTIYNSLYNKPELVKGLETWGSLAEKAGTTRAGLAYRWIIYHSELSKQNGDAVIIGVRSVAQLEQIFEFVNEGPIKDESIVSEIDKLWDNVKDEAPVNNYSFVEKQISG
ncbi:hypothetical protein DASC09_055940 [Saccharomycopsis crataegensis]|uniref:NADP-dependent oxidoreductase domain-containing protein n=1 Tax=Saccharomycopsis crataegensis TaxID=43959 RepID=A0AAV5QVP7_9ASCO|nr:hypothetical protein DASC09_055940 [Saccharomycopsis crataegensis]